MKRKITTAPLPADPTQLPLLSQRLHTIRGSKSVSSIACAIGITTNRYTLFECGDELPTVLELARISQYFDVPTDYLLGLSESPNFSSSFGDDAMRIISRMISIEAEAQKNRIALLEEVRNVQGRQ